MAGNDDDPGLLARVQLLRGGQVNPGSAAAVPGPLGRGSWGVRPDLERGRRRRPPFEQLVRKKIVEIALAEVTQGTQAKPTGVAAQVPDPSPAPAGRVYRTGWAKLLDYFHTALGGNQSQYSDTNVMYYSGPGGQRLSITDWCGLFALWAIKKGCEAFAGHPGVPSPSDWVLGTGISNAPTFRLRGSGELPQSGDIGVKKKPIIDPSTGRQKEDSDGNLEWDYHHFLVHSFDSGTKTLYAIDGNSTLGGITTSVPGVPNFDGPHSAYSFDGSVLVYTLKF
jgi:hypothetical protein